MCPVEVGSSWGFRAEQLEEQVRHVMSLARGGEGGLGQDGSSVLRGGLETSTGRWVVLLVVGCIVLESWGEARTGPSGGHGQTVLEVFCHEEGI